MQRLPLFWLATAFILGVFSAASLPATLLFWRTAALAALLLALLEGFFCYRRYHRPAVFVWLPVPLFLVLGLFFLAGWRQAGTQQTPRPDSLAFFNGSGRVRLEGTVINDPFRGEGSIRLVVAVDSLQLPQGFSQVVKGKLLVLTRPGEYQYGQRLLINGALETPPEDEVFSYRAYLARQGIASLTEFPRIHLLSEGQGSWFFRQVYALRRLAYQRIQTFYPQPEAGLLSGILLGVENDIPADLEAAYQETGTAHIIAISGFNMTLLTGLCLKFFRRRFSLWWAGLLAVLTIAFYTLLVGAAPAVVRAAVMSGLAMTASLIGRRQAGVFTLLITAAVMLAFNPLLLGDAGFQLSVMATLGLILYADRLLDWFRQLAARWLPTGVVSRIAGPVGEYFLFTLAAQVTILPVLLAHFERLSFSTLLANPLILPPQPFIMQAGGLVLIIGLFLPPLGQVLAYGVWLLLAFTNQAVTWLAGLSFGALNTGPIGLPVVVLLYALLFFFTLTGRWQRWLQPLRKPVFLSTAGLLVVGLSWNLVLHRPEGKLQIFLPGEPNANVIFLRTPGGKNVLLNTGTHPNTLSAHLNRRMSVFERRLDAVLILRSNLAYYQSLDVLASRFDTRYLVWAAPPAETFTARHLQEGLLEQGVSIHNAASGETLDCGDGVAITILAQTGDTASLLLTHQDLRVLITDGSLTDSQLAELIQVNVVIVYGTAQEMPAWQALAPEIVIDLQTESSDEQNVVSLSQHGWMALETDGRSLRITAER